VPDPVQVLTRLGGVAGWTTLRRGSSWRAIQRAVDDGAILRVGHGRYVLPSIEPARAAASRLTAASSHTSAALFHGWPVAHVPELPHVTVSPRRNLPSHRRDGVHVHWRSLDAADIVDGWVTSPVRTVIDCCLDLPFAEALAVFDSSWRAGLKPKAVQLAARSLSARQRDRVWRVAAAADPRAANPFESVLRAIALDVPGLSVEPQFVVRDPDFYARVDLADENLEIVLEADSFEFHSSAKALDRDARRYNGLTVRGWLVLRFTWKQVMFEPELVAATLAAAVALRRRSGRSTGARPRIPAFGG
jgi:very-short-patch-repair endonuclease